MKKGLLIFSLFMIGCASGNCRSQQKVEAKTTETTTTVSTSKAGEASGASAMANTSTPQERIKVYKYDGSLQCGQGKAVPVSEMAKELKGIKIYSSENKQDTLMRTMVCGTPTGQANVYEIDKASLPAAKKAGFKEWTFE